MTVDFDGEPREQQCRPDMGVDETSLFFNDCNTNGQADACDLESGASFDCNGTLVPDECEGDCNGNGLADSCDLASGASPDFNGNGIPDECEPDCNENGLPDFIDAAFGFCDDDNGRCDECDGCGADLVDNDAIDISDLLALLAAWGFCPGCSEDLNGDDVVDIQDLLALLAEWGPCFADEADCTVIENCQLPSLFTTSASDGNLGRTADNVVLGPSATAITGLCWWGVYLDWNTVLDCGPGPDDFEVRYYADDGAGLPGALLASYSQGAGTLDTTFPIATGDFLLFQNLREFRWKATHAPLAVTPGECLWVEIVNTGPTGSCIWSWETGQFGDGQVALSDSGGPYQITVGDVAFCLNVEMDHSFPPCAGPFVSPPAPPDITRLLPTAASRPPTAPTP